MNDSDISIYTISYVGFLVPHREDKSGWEVRNKELSALWKSKSEDEKAVFEDPFFFALANLPNLSDEDTNEPLDEDPDGIINLAAEVSAPKVHQLTEAEEIKYRPLFDRLVDVNKVHQNHGKPEKSEPVAKLQLKSLAAFRKAHHVVSLSLIGGGLFHLHLY